MNLRYPVGSFHFDGEPNESVINYWIKEIEDLPRKLKQALEGLTDEQLDTAYRPDGWTIRQVVHHLADSHLNSYVRFKLALTEDTPVIKPYLEELWAELPDSKLPIDVSLKLLEALHLRWVTLLMALTPSDFKRTFFHPESGEMTLGKSVGIYAWHGRHHLAHITSLRERSNW